MARILMAIKYMVIIIIVIVLIIITLNLFFRTFEYFDKDKFKPKLDSFIELKNYLQYHFIVSIDSLENFTGESYRLEWDKKTNEKIWDYRTWATFKSKTDNILKNKDLYKMITLKEDKTFYLKYFFELPLDTNIKNEIDTIILDSLECEYDIGRMREVDVLSWLMYDRQSKKYYFARCTGHRVRFPVKKNDKLKEGLK